jgi:hypothetical protein
MPAPIDWTPELESGVIEGIEAGLTLRQVAEKHKISAAFILKQAKLNSSFCEQYARAIDNRTDIDFEGLADQIAQEPQSNKFGVDPGWVAWKRVQIDTLKWALSKRCPKKYGDKLGLTGADGEGPAEIVVRRIGPK